MAPSPHNAPMNKLLLIVFLLLAPAAWAAPAEETQNSDDLPAATQDHAQIRETIARFVQQQTETLSGKVTFQVGEIDRRIRLQKCPRIEAFLPAGSRLAGKTSVGVRCSASATGKEQERSGSSMWSIFVPVQIKISLDLLTSARQLPPGHTLEEQDLARQTTESSHPVGFTDARQVVGKVLRYGISAGQILRKDMLRDPYVITQRQVVPVVVQGKGFTVRSEGTALNNASEGLVVRIRMESGRVISGVARADGTVEVAP